MNVGLRLGLIGLMSRGGVIACTVDALPYPQRDGAPELAARGADDAAPDAKVAPDGIGDDACAPCAEGQRCVDGECRCPTGSTRCGESCRDTRTDGTNCGACGVTCMGFQTCLEGRCGCERATLTPGEALRGVDMRSGRAPANACSAPGEGTGNAVFFRVRVSARSRVTLRAAPQGPTPWQPTIRVYDSCVQQPPCWAYRSAPAPGTTAVLAVDNEALLPRDFVVAVSPQAADNAGTLDMLADVTPLSRAPAYALNTIPGACDDTALGRVVSLSGTGPSWTSPIAPLPFPFVYFGRSVGHYSVTSSGFAQLWESSAGTPLAQAEGSPIEEITEGLSGVVAAFWDGLRPQAAMGASPLRAASLGDAPHRRFVIDWDDWRFEDGDQHIRLQIKLFETTGALEFHYCELTPSTQPRVLGAQATIGITRPSGAGGALIAHRVANALDTTRAFRLTPQM